MTEESYDVIIVGAGAAGAIVANELASDGAKVLVIEAGPERGPRQTYIDNYYAAAAKTPGSPYPGWPLTPTEAAPVPSVLDIAGSDWKDGSKYYLDQKGPAPFSSTYERLGGGTTNHWNAVSLRHLPADFELKTRYGVEGARDWPIEYDDLESYYADAEVEIGVAGNSAAWQGYLGATRSTAYPMDEIPQTYLDKVLKTAVESATIRDRRVRVMPTPQARNSQVYDDRPRCMGNTSCVPICPIQAKYDSTVHLAKAQKHQHSPARVLYQAVAHRVMVSKKNDQVSGIKVKLWERSGGRLRVEERTFVARVYILCAHAIETPKLLLNSPWKGDLTVANSSKCVGLHLMDQVTAVSWALSKKPVFPFRGPLSTSSINEFRDDPKRRDRAAYIIHIANDGASWPDGAPYSTVWDAVYRDGLTGSALRASLAHDVSRQVMLTGELEMLPSAGNRVTVSKTHTDALGIPRPEICFGIDDYTKRGFVDASRTHQAIFAAMGTIGDPVRQNLPNPSSPGYFEFEGRGYQFRGPGHIMGTLRMGEDRGDSVVDAQCKSHDHANLYLLGSGVFPTSATANPTLTIVALALRAAKQIINDLHSLDFAEETKS